MDLESTQYTPETDDKMKSSIGNCVSILMERLSEKI